MMNLETVQVGAHSLQISMMKGKTMAMAACVSACFLAAEAIFVPMAMNSSYDRYEVSQAPSMAAVEEVQQAPVKERSRLVPLTPIKKHGRSNGDVDREPVS